MILKSRVLSICIGPWCTTHLLQHVLSCRIHQVSQGKPKISLLPEQHTSILPLNPSLSDPCMSLIQQETTQISCPEERLWRRLICFFTGEWNKAIPGMAQQAPEPNQDMRGGWSCYTYIRLIFSSQTKTFI